HIAALFQTTVQNIGYHIRRCEKEHERDKDAVVKYYFITASDNKNYKTAFYNLEAILAVGFRVRSPRGTQFRRWANTTLKEYLQKGFILDDERLKNPDGRPDYFDELLARIRDIRASEKRFYQKLRDLFALSEDYNKTDAVTQQFFAETQNKLIYGITGQTAAELIMSRADATKPNMALTTWKGSIVRKQDIYTAKNYLTNDEIDSLNRLVSIFLESAEFRAKMRKTLTLSYWQNTVDKLLADHEIPILHTPGSRSRKQMKSYVDTEYEKFNERRKEQEALLADKQDLENLEAETKLLQQSKNH
ncbi:virulence RhuM family protein, partial [uncultured Megasphaera sp.]|uniref:virulence RhuM family protein n=1 Tax=uncultured Megasphaera sp. TaxID=165188 RepID=UPI00265DF19E